MTNEKEIIVMYESAEAARKVSIMHEGQEIGTGYLSIDGHFWSEEASARYSSHTHFLCDCGQMAEKFYSACDKCIEAKRKENYFKMPIAEWKDGDYAVLLNSDSYFPNKADFIDWCAVRNLDPKSQMLVLCDEIHLSPLDAETWADELPEDGELPDKVEQALTVFNEVIKRQGPVSYTEGKYRIEIA